MHCSVNQSEIAFVARFEQSHKLSVLVQDLAPVLVPTNRGDLIGKSEDDEEEEEEDWWTKM